jgi:hypothetical protein
MTSENDSGSSSIQKFKEVIKNAITPSEVDVDDLKNEIWEDLSTLYFRYKSDGQKQAFREVMTEIGEKVHNDNWDQVYQKLYREGKKKNLV